MVTYKLPHKDFFAALKEGKLLGLRCNDCGAYTCPPKINCNECTSMNIEIVELKGKGEIKTFTVMRVAPEGFESWVPYIVALVQLEEGPNLVGNIIGVDPNTITNDIIGKKVVVGWQPPPSELRYCGPIGKDGKIQPGGIAMTFSLV